MDHLAEEFHTKGYLGPVRFCDQAEAERLLRERYLPASQFTWYKSPHERSALMVETASSPKFLENIRPLIGDDILLWGSHFIGQPPGQTHEWHLDVEYGKWDGVTLWLGLKNLNSKTTVSLISHSHLLPEFPNDLKRRGVDLKDEKAVLAEAKKLDPRCELKTFTLEAGEFIIWSGRIWHSTLNLSDKKRYSVIFQFCSPDNATFIPLNYEYPGTKWSDVKPPCVLVSGVDNQHLNKLVPREDLGRSDDLSKKIASLAHRVRFYFGAAVRKFSS